MPRMGSEEKIHLLCAAVKKKKEKQRLLVGLRQGPLPPPLRHSIDAREFGGCLSERIVGLFVHFLRWSLEGPTLEGDTHISSFTSPRHPRLGFKRTKNIKSERTYLYLSENAREFADQRFSVPFFICNLSLRAVLFFHSRDCNRPSLPAFHSQPCGTWHSSRLFETNQIDFDELL